jgi:hypothetical protein
VLSTTSGSLIRLCAGDVRSSASRSVPGTSDPVLTNAGATAEELLFAEPTVDLVQRLVTELRYALANISSVPDHCSPPARRRRRRRAGNPDRPARQVDR